MKSNTQRLAVSIALLTTATALLLIVERGGVIAWGGFILSALLLIKCWFKSSARDPILAGGLAAFLVIAWFGTLNYVLSTWESGEVVELVIDTENGAHTARLWVLDVGEHPVVYYDATPEAAMSLLAGKPLQFTRSGEVSTRIPNATRVDALTEDEANEVLAAMATKYGDLNGAADIYYVLLGRPRDRIDVVVSLVEA